MPQSGLGLCALPVPGSDLGGALQPKGDVSSGTQPLIQPTPSGATNDTTRQQVVPDHTVVNLR